MTNETFRSAICDQTFAGSSIFITNPDCYYVLLPSDCLNSSFLIGVNADCVVIGSFNWSSSMSQISINKGIYSKGATASLSSPDVPSTPTTLSVPSAEPTGDELDGFDEGGNIDWNELYQLFPTLSNVVFNGGNLRGSLPATIPETIYVFQVPDNDLTGTIPSTLYSTWANISNGFYLDVSGNNLTGTLPGSLFSSFVIDNSVTNVIIDLSSNSLSGPLPGAWFQRFGSLVIFSLIVNNNQLNGSLPSDLFPSSGFLGTTVTNGFIMDLSSNEFEGSIPATFLRGISELKTSFSLKMANNKLSGSLPPNFLPTWSATADSPSMTLELSNNALSGSIPSTFLTGNLDANVTLSFLAILLDNNQLEGTIPSTLFTTPSGSKRSHTEQLGSESESASLSVVSLRTDGSLTMNLTSNRLTGPIPSTLLSYALLPPVSPILLAANNQLSGDFLDSFFGALPSGISSLQLYIANNSISATVPTTCPPATALLDLNQNDFVGTIPEVWANCTILTVQLAESSRISGSFPAALFNSPHLYYLNISYTGVSGELPATISAVAQYADMRYTNIDFCSSLSNTSFSTFTGTSCSLEGTSACGCPLAYPTCTTTVCPPTNPTTPPTAPAPVSFLTCPEATRPSLDFVCVNGVWTAKDTNVNQIVIPSNAGSIVITGNATSTSIVVNGLGTTITIEGCASNLSNIVVELSANDIAKMSSKTLQTLIVLSSSASQCTSLSNIALSTVTTSKTCKKVNAEKVLSADGNTMSALFTVSSSGCNTWWIILVSVVVGVVLIGTAIAVVAGVLWNRNKASKQSKMLRNQKRNPVRDTTTVSK